MIFVTVGTQLPFPRLLDMAAQVLPPSNNVVFAQTADPAYDGPLPGMPHLSRAQFEEHCRAADIIIGHAGMGTILAARRFGTPLIIVPRHHHLGEHRNDHQHATAQQLSAAGFGGVANDPIELTKLVTDPPAIANLSNDQEKTRLIHRIGELVR